MVRKTEDIYSFMGRGAGVWRHSDPYQHGWLSFCQLVPPALTAFLMILCANFPFLYPLTLL